MLTFQDYSPIAPCFYLLAFLASLRQKTGMVAAVVLIVPAMGMDVYSTAARYYHSLPMIPLYAGSMALPLYLGAVFIVLGASRRAIGTTGARRTLLFWATLISVVSLLFPKNFYLPFLKSATVSAHLFLGFGMAGKACFFVSAAWAFSGLNESGWRSEKDVLQRTGKQAFTWAAWGFALFTISMFSGELWSYRVWGTPVVWDDPAITTTMAIWFFYVGFLHLHLTGSWSLRARSLYAASGAVAVLILNVFPDTGPFRWPF